MYNVKILLLCIEILSAVACPARASNRGDQEQPTKNLISLYSKPQRDSNRE